MKHTRRLTAAALGAALGFGLLGAGVRTQGRDGGPIRVAADSVRDVRDWDARVTRMERAGTLKVRKEQADTLLPGRKFVRLAQYYQGVPVWGGEVVVETDGRSTRSVLTNLYDGIALRTDPVLSPDDARRAIERLGGATLGPDRLGQLVVYPTNDGRYRLAYTQRIATLRDVRRFFVDAQTGARLDDYSEVLAQSAVGSGTGVMGDTKKISTTRSAGAYITDDALRPPALHTYDLRGNPYRYIDWLNDVVSLTQSDFGSDSDNVWTDQATVDGHVHVGWTYDYFFKRFGRKGLDDNNSGVQSVVHVVNRKDLQSYIASGLIDYLQDFYVNAFYINGTGIFTFGEGLPGGWTLGGQTYNYLAGGLDIVAHEFTHGVTDYSSHLGSTGEPRSLNEAFSDMMAVSAEFYYHAGRADYTIGEDVISGGIRSLSNPAAFDGVDHYSKRKPFVGHEYENSSIASHAFYLAIEGGTNRTSGAGVQGVGAANREQIEKSFYRGFTSLTSQATFSLARARTIDSARALYGVGSAAERAVTQAWDAVGVN